MAFLFSSLLCCAALILSSMHPAFWPSDRLSCLRHDKASRRYPLFILIGCELFNLGLFFFSLFPLSCKENFQKNRKKKDFLFLLVFLFFFLKKRNNIRYSIRVCTYKKKKKERKKQQVDLRDSRRALGPEPAPRWRAVTLQVREPCISVVVVVGQRAGAAHTLTQQPALSLTLNYSTLCEM